MEGSTRMRRSSSKQRSVCSASTRTGSWVISYKWSLGMCLWRLASVSCPLGQTYEQVEFSVGGQEVAVSEEKELDLPEADGFDPEGVGLGPVLAVGQGDVERGPGRAVDLDGFVVSRCRVVDDPHADEIDADRIVHARS